MFTDARRQGVGLMLLLLVPPAFCLFGRPARAEQSGQAAAARTSTYVFVPAESTVVRTGGIAGIHRTYTITGTFQLTADFEAGTATFDRVDANAVDDSPDRRTLDPNDVFNMTQLAGVIIDRTTIQFEGTTDDGSSVLITLTFLRGNTVTLKGQTIPPPNSADFFVFTLDTVAESRDGGEPPVHPSTSTYVFDLNRSTVLQTGGFAGVHTIYSVKGQFQLTVDWGNASFRLVDASLIDETGNVYAQSLNEIFNLSGQTGDVVDINGTVVFAHTTADGTNSDVHLTVTFTDDIASLVGKTTPPPNSADMFSYDLNAIALRKYAGGTGELDTPYLIAAAEQMNAIGAEPNDWDKHFKLIADIDLGGYSGTDFHIIAPAGKGVYFTGVFDGGGHTICNFTYGPADANSVALFGNVKGRIENVGLIDPNIDAGARDGVAPLVDWLNKGNMSGCYVRGGIVSGNEWVGGLVAYNTGTITDCFSTAAVDGQIQAGGLAGYNNGVIAGCSSTGGITGKRSVGGLLGWNDGTVTGCSSTRDVTGNSRVGGLVGDCGYGTISNCSSTGRVAGVSNVGGLVGRSYGVISNCYSTGEVFGDLFVGGLVGFNLGEVFNCYSAGGVTGRLKVGGLVGAGLPEDVIGSFWDIETSGQTTSTGGIGKTTAEMRTAGTFLEAGWDFVGETVNGTEDIWKIAEGLDYPQLLWKQMLADDFEDGVALPLWQVYEPNEQKIWVEETNGRLEVRASEAADNINAAYVSNGWRLDVTNDFKMKVNFHYGKRNAGDSWVMIALAPSLEQPISRIITFEAGCLDYQWFYLYEAIDGAWRTEETSDRSSDDGTLYVSFSADKDELYLSYTGYGTTNAWRTVTGLLKNRWAAEPVYVALGGGSNQASLDAADAYLDDFVIDSGLLQ